MCILSTSILAQTVFEKILSVCPHYSYEKLLYLNILCIGSFAVLLMISNISSNLCVCVGTGEAGMMQMSWLYEAKWMRQTMNCCSMGRELQ